MLLGSNKEPSRHPSFHARVVIAIENNIDSACIVNRELSSQNTWAPDAASAARKVCCWILHQQEVVRARGLG
jgi:hypothetical protein